MEMKERILYVRENCGLSQDAFAERIGVTKSAISGYETGRREPSLQVLRSISREFQYDEHWLKTGEGEPLIPDAYDVLDELFHQFSCSDFEMAFLKAYFDLKDNERAQFCSHLEKLFNSAVYDAKERRRLDAAFAASMRRGFDPTPAPDEIDPAADLDIEAEVESYCRELIEQKKAGPNRQPPLVCPAPQEMGSPEMTGPVYDWLTGDPPASLDAAAAEYGLDVRDKIFLYLLMKHGELRRMVMDACEAVADDVNILE